MFSTRKFHLSSWKFINEKAYQEAKNIPLSQKNIKETLIINVIALITIKLEFMI